MRPNKATLSELYRRRQEVFSAFELPEGAVSAHVRHGDKACSTKQSDLFFIYFSTIFLLFLVASYQTSRTKLHKHTHTHTLTVEYWHICGETIGFGDETCAREGLFECRRLACEKV
jgi:hypothetical protein